MSEFELSRAEQPFGWVWSWKEQSAGSILWTGRLSQQLPAEPDVTGLNRHHHSVCSFWVVIKEL